MSERYLLGDWGTTQLRLYLMECGRVLDVREGVGIGRLAKPAVQALEELTAQWIGLPSPMHAIFGGMASSRNGLAELPYLQAPADAVSWASAARNLDTDSLKIRLATGVQCGDEAGGFDVMRGEEAQIFGALQIDPELSRGTHYFVLPGTHSKWVEVAHGRIVSFRTAVTGELYGLLIEHSSLLKAGIENGDRTQFDAGFAAGAHRSLVRDSLLTALFTARTAQLLQGRTSRWASGFLSGLLIGSELSMERELGSKSSDIMLIGETELTSLYQKILEARGIRSRILDGAQCAMRGLNLLHDPPRSSSL